MKFGKKTTALCAVVVGAAIFTTSALADVVAGSGYNSLKDALKQTSRVVSNEADNYTVDMTAKLSADGNEILHMMQTAKVDRVGNKRENIGKTISVTGTDESYHYEDSEKYIYWVEDDQYTVSERWTTDAAWSAVSEDVFEEEMVQDAEKVVDAFVGNLKDLVQVEENDGKKMYIGNVSDAQIPTVANAVLSFALKYSVFENNTTEESGLPELKHDIYVKSVSGTAVENEEGILENAVITGTLIGKDENGVEHMLDGECTFTLHDMHQTTVTEPDLSNKQVKYVGGNEVLSHELGQKYVGRYKIDIIDTVDEQFVKIGERNFTITSAEGERFTATYTEQYKDGYAPETVRNYDIVGYWDDDCNDFVLEYVDEHGNTAYGSLYRRQGDVHINFGIEFSEDGSGYAITEDMNFRSNDFIRVFD